MSILISFDEHLANYVDAVQAFEDEHFAKDYPNLVPPRFETLIGKRYVRVVRQERCHVYKDGQKTDDIVNGGGRSVHCFVDKVNGDILKPAGWKGPETKHARGNIFASEQPVAYGLYIGSPGVTGVLRTE